LGIIVSHFGTFPRVGVTDYAAKHIITVRFSDEKIPNHIDFAIVAKYTDSRPQVVK
jgi:hypothetical protein